MGRREGGRGQAPFRIGEAPDAGRVLVDLARRIRRTQENTARKGRGVPRRAGERQREGDQGRKAYLRRFGTEERVRGGSTVPRPDGNGLELRRRRGAFAHRQDL